MKQKKLGRPKTKNPRARISARVESKTAAWLRKQAGGIGRAIDALVKKLGEI